MQAARYSWLERFKQDLTALKKFPQSGGLGLLFLFCILFAIVVFIVHSSPDSIDVAVKLITEQLFWIAFFVIVIVIMSYMLAVKRDHMVGPNLFAGLLLISELIMILLLFNSINGFPARTTGIVVQNPISFDLLTQGVHFVILVFVFLSVFASVYCVAYLINKLTPGYFWYAVYLSTAFFSLVLLWYIIIPVLYAPVSFELDFTNPSISLICYPGDWHEPYAYFVAGQGISCRQIEPSTNSGLYNISLSFNSSDSHQVCETENLNDSGWIRFSRLARRAGLYTVSATLFNGSTNNISSTAEAPQVTVYNQDEYKDKIVDLNGPALIVVSIFAFIFVGLAPTIQAIRQLLEENKNKEHKGKQP